MNGTRPRPPADSGRISAWQLALLLAIIPMIEDGTAINHWLAWRVGIDQWVSVLIALPLTLAGVAMFFRLANRFPGSGLVEILLRTIGPLGYGVAIAYVLLFLCDAALSVREFGVLSREISFMSLTPYGVFAVILLLVVVYGAWLGIEVVARVNVAFFLYVDMPLGIALSALSVNHDRISRLLPIMAHGVEPVLWGVWLLVGKFGELVLLLVFLPLVGEQRQRARAVTLWSVVISTALTLEQCVGPVLMFGSSVRLTTWPWFSQVRAIFVARFITNLEWMMVIFWIHGFLVETSMFLYGASLMLTKMFGARDRRPFLLAMAGVVLVGSFILGRTQAGMLEERWMLDAYGFLVMAWLVPLILLGIALVRRQGHANPPLGRAARRSPVVIDPPGQTDTWKPGEGDTGPLQI